MNALVRSAALLAVVALVAMSTKSPAQDYPSRVTKIVVAYAAGGGADVMARIFAQKLSERMGQSFVVENRPGGNAMIGAGSVAKSAPDGYTLLVGASSEMVLNAAIYPQMPYDPVADFAPVTKLYSNPMLFALHPSVKANSVAELIALAKAEPGKLNYASGAAIFYLTGEMFNHQAGINIVRVPYKGSGEALNDVVSGQVPLLVTSLPTAMGQVRAGMLRGLAVTSLKRDALLPELPTMSEAGVKDFEVVSWTGLYAAAGTPRPIIERLNREMAAIVKLDDVRERAASLGVTLEWTSPEEQGASQKAEIARLKALIQQLGINLR